MRSDRRVSRLVVVLVLAAAAAGCGGGEDRGEAARTTSGSSGAADDQKTLTDLDACTLLTAEEIESATGYAPGEGSDPVKSVSGAAPICAWPAKDGSVHQVAQVLVSWSASKTFDDYRQLMAKEGVTKIRQVDGPGRFSVVLEEMNMVQAFGERFMVQTMVEAKDGRDPVEAAVALAAAAMERVE